MTFKEWTERYFATALHKRPTTMARDRSVAGTHFLPALGNRPIGSITPLDVRRLVEHMSVTLSPATVRTNYAVLRAILAAAVDADLLAVTPCRGVRLPPQTRGEIRFLSSQELERLAVAVPLPYRAMIYLAGVAGLRWSEIAGLRVGRIDFLRRTVSVVETCSEVEGRLIFADVKTPASRRTVAIPAFLIEVLAEHLKRADRQQAKDLVFTAPEGGPLRRSLFRQRVWLPAVEQADLKGLTFHGLRHSAAGLMIELGAHPRIMQARLGHSSIRTTLDVYGHVLPTADEAVTSAIDELFASSRGLPAASTRSRSEDKEARGA
jgi:integrase